jgi:hypothetical protein
VQASDRAFERGANGRLLEASFRQPESAYQYAELIGCRLRERTREARDSRVFFCRAATLADQLRRWRREVRRGRSATRSTEFGNLEETPWGMLTVGEWVARLA